tara:strand:- start:243 stop:557 length:315 start_codon:yes stop_codon:yes gene_type:complete
MEQNKLLPCVPSFTPLNRREKRLQWFEFERNYKNLFEIEDCFIKAIFKSDISYLDAYNTYLEVWIYYCNWMQSQGKFKMTQPNSHYFEALYKPIEDINHGSKRN